MLRVEEAPDIAAVWLRSRTASAPDISLHRSTRTTRFVPGSRRSSSQPGRYGCRRDGTVVAMLVLHDNWIDQLYVDPRHTGHGIGTALVSLAKAHRPQGLRLWTFQANQRARRFYETQGFVPVESTEGDNEENSPDVRYEWRPVVS